MTPPILRPLADLCVTVDQPIELGLLPEGVPGHPATGSEVVGERVHGVVLPGGADWNTLRTDDGVTIGVAHEAFHPRAPDALPARRRTRSRRAWRARGIPRFEAPDGPFAWLNGLVCVSTIRPRIERGMVRIDGSEVA